MPALIWNEGYSDGDDNDVLIDQQKRSSSIIELWSPKLGQKYSVNWLEWEMEHRFPWQGWYRRDAVGWSQAGDNMTLPSGRVTEGGEQAEVKTWLYDKRGMHIWCLSLAWTTWPGPSRWPSPDRIYDGLELTAIQPHFWSPHNCDLTSREAHHCLFTRVQLWCVSGPKSMMGGSKRCLRLSGNRKHTCIPMCFKNGWVRCAEAVSESV